MIERVEALEEQVNKIKEQQTTENLKYQRFINFLGLSGLTILLATFLLTLFGVVDLTVKEYDTLTYPQEFFINILLLQINILCYLLFAYNQSMMKIFLKSIMILGTIFLSYYFIPQNYAIISSIIIPLTIGLLSNIKNLKGHLLNLFYWIVIYIFQLIFKYIKLNIFDFDYTSVNAITMAILSIDLIIFNVFLIKVVRKYVGLASRLVHRLPWNISKRRIIQQDCNSNSELTQKQLAVKRLIQLTYFGVQFTVLLIIANIGSTLIEMIILIVMFIIGRYLLGGAWHSNSLKACFLVSTLSFYIVTKTILPISVSMFTIVVGSGTFIYLMHYIGLKADRLEELEKKYETDFTKYGLSYEMAQFAYDWKVNGLHDKELMVKYEINSINTLNSRKRRVKSAMNTK